MALNLNLTKLKITKSNLGIFEKKSLIIETKDETVLKIEQTKKCF